MCFLQSVGFRTRSAWPSWMTIKRVKKSLDALNFQIKVRSTIFRAIFPRTLFKNVFCYLAPNLPPADVRIGSASPSLLLLWKPPPLTSRNGRLLAYEVECSWVDVSMGFTESWRSKSLRIQSTLRSGSTLFWPSGKASLLNISANAAAASFGTVYRGRVRALTSAGPGPWSGYETQSLKNLGKNLDYHLNN